jgi:hypothetical protein
MLGAIFSIFTWNYTFFKTDWTLKLYLCDRFLILMV